MGVCQYSRGMKSYSSLLACAVCNERIHLHWELFTHMRSVCGHHAWLNAFRIHCEVTDRSGPRYSGSLEPLCVPQKINHLQGNCKLSPNHHYRSGSVTYLQLNTCWKQNGAWISRELAGNQCVCMCVFGSRTRKHTELRNRKTASEKRAKGKMSEEMKSKEMSFSSCSSTARVLC